MTSDSDRLIKKQEARAAVYDVRIENPSAGNPEIDCDIGNSLITPLNPDCGFIPRTITINPGDQIRWINNDADRSHDPSSDPHPTHEAYPILNMVLIPSGGSVVSSPLMSTGVWGCHSHTDSNFRCIITVSSPGGSGGGATVIDKTKPVITEVKIIPAETTATISWKTDEPASTQIEVGSNGTYDYIVPNPLDPRALYFHEIILDDLVPDKKYHFRVKSIDASNNLGVSEDIVFKTLPLISAAETKIINIMNGMKENGQTQEQLIKSLQSQLLELLKQLVGLLNQLKLIQQK
ncbi:MAG: hypothetical protein HYW34_03075 [Candidatus Brennerbacteria bacterium]|nr:hypothetical protein [Candidatus Brennerbacteria bacterium]